GGSPSRAAHPATLPVLPHGNDAGWQLRQVAEIHPALARAVEIGAAGGANAEHAAERRVLRVLRRRVCRGEDLERISAGVADLPEQAAHAARADAIAPGVCDHGLSAREMDPVDRLLERRPGMGNVPRLAGDEVLLEDFLDVARMPSLNQPAREVA